MPRNTQSRLPRAPDDIGGCLPLLADTCLSGCFTMPLNVVVVTLQESALKTPSRGDTGVAGACTAASQPGEPRKAGHLVTFVHKWFGKAQGRLPPLPVAVR